MFLGYIPADQVNVLASEIKAKSSKFYTGSNGIAQQLALRVDSGFALNSVQDPNAGTDGGSSVNETSGSASSSKKRQDVIIGVVSALGAIALSIIALLAYRSYQRRRERAHRRLSDEDPVSRPEGGEFDRDSIGEPRRRSFYFAADASEAAGHIRSNSDDYFDYRSGPDHGMREHLPVLPGTISRPNLQQSSMNW